MLRTMIGTMIKLSAAALTVASVMAGPALAQEFPSRPIRLILGFDSGSGLDSQMRTIAPAMEKILGQPVVVENRPGAGGAIAWTEVSKAKPDGHTLGSVQFPAIAGLAVTGGIPFDPLQGFEFLGNFISQATVLVVRKDSPYQSVSDMIEYLKKNPDGISYASNGAGSLDGLIALALGDVAGVRFRQVFFNATNETVVAVLGGHVDTMTMSVSTAKELLASGEIRVLAIGGNERNPVLPDVPTFAEQGYPLAVNASNRGIVMPVGADPAIVTKLRETIKAAVEDTEYLERAKKLSQEVRYLSPEDVRKEVEAQIEFIKRALPPQ